MKFSLFLFVIISLNLEASTSAPFVIYGEDNRLDTFEVRSALHRRLADSTAAMIHKSQIVQKGSVAELLGGALSDSIPYGMRERVCTKEKFSHQPVVANCSGFLVTPDTIITAGHCMMSYNDCSEFNWVFNYKVSDAHQTAVSVSLNDIYECKSIVKQGMNGTSDFAVVRLTKRAKAQPVTIAKADPVFGTPIVMIGHPSGLPQKVSAGAEVSQTLAYGFNTNLDAFKGNSGSAVFNANSGELLGILVNGNADYKHNDELNCSEVNVLNVRGGEGVSSFTQFLPYLTDDKI